MPPNLGYRLVFVDHIRKPGSRGSAGKVRIVDEVAVELMRPCSRSRSLKLPKAVFDAYCKSKQIEYQRLREHGWVFETLPWIGKEVEETIELMGENYWPYGIDANRKALETLFQYSFEQGLAKKVLKIEDLFHPSALGFNEKA